MQVVNNWTGYDFCCPALSWMALQPDVYIWGCLHDYIWTDGRMQYDILSQLHNMYAIGQVKLPGGEHGMIVTTQVSNLN
jgi:hypothetical protein